MHRFAAAGIDSPRSIKIILIFFKINGKYLVGKSLKHMREAISNPSNAFAVRPCFPLNV